MCIREFGENKTFKANTIVCKRAFFCLTEPINEVMLGANISLKCVAVESLMPFVLWKSSPDLTLKDQMLVGKNVL